MSYPLHGALSGAIGLSRRSECPPLGQKAVRRGLRGHVGRIVDSRGVAMDVPRSSFMAVIAQLVRAQDCDSWGRGFESRQPPFSLAFDAGHAFGCIACRMAGTLCEFFESSRGAFFVGHEPLASTQKEPVHATPSFKSFCYLLRCSFQNSFCWQASPLAARIFGGIGRLRSHDRFGGRRRVLDCSRVAGLRRNSPRQCQRRNPLCMHRHRRKRAKRFG